MQEKNGILKVWGKKMQIYLRMSKKSINFARNL